MSGYLLENDRFSPNRMCNFTFSKKTRKYIWEDVAMLHHSKVLTDWDENILSFGTPSKYAHLQF